jgi:protein SCO1
MPRSRLLLTLLLTILASVGGGFLAFAFRPKKPIDESLGTVPPFRFTERSGKPIANADLDGKVWLASFVFTRCNGTCPAVAATLSRVQTELADVPNFRIVTFTIDPERDTPDDLKQYAERYRADAERWLFLTGPEKEIHDLSNQGFHLLAKKRADPKPGDEFDHATYLALVDQKGVIVDVFPGLPPKVGDPSSYEDGLTRLKAAVRTLARR